MKLVAWTAKRVGPGITIDGLDIATGDPVKLTGVRAIKGGDPSAIAEGYVRGQRSIVSLGGNPPADWSRA